MEIPSKAFIILGIIVAAFSYMHVHLSKTNALLVFIIIGVCFIIYGLIKYFFIEKEEPKKQPVHHRRQHPSHQTTHRQQHHLKHSPLRQQLPRQSTHVACPRCHNVVGVEAHFCPNCGTRRSHSSKNLI